MAYFDYLPNVYVGEGVKDDEAYKYRLVKNIFRRIQVRERLEKYTTYFERVNVPEGATPSSIADELFGDPLLDWVILITNNIVDVYDQWPRTETDLLKYVNETYEDPDAVHHYETKEALYNNKTFIKEGIEVNSTWRTVLPDGTTLGEEQSIYPVSNYEHEQFLNEKKRLITIPTTDLANRMIDEFRDLVAYDPHAELDDEGNKRSPLSVASRFLDVAGSSTASGPRTDVQTEAVTSFNNGPTSAGVASASTSVSTTTPTPTPTPSPTPTPTPSPTPSPSPSPSDGGGGGGGYGGGY